MSRRRKMARRYSRVCGLLIAAITAAALYIVLVRPAAHPAQAKHVPPTSGPSISERKSPAASEKKSLAVGRVIALHRVATLTPAGEINAVQVSPSGQIVVAVSGGGQVGAWSASTWRPLSTWGALSDGIPDASRRLSSLTFSPSGNLVAALDMNFDSGDTFAALWNAATGHNTVVPLVGSISHGYTSSMALGPGGLVAGAYPDGSVELERKSTGQAVATLTFGTTTPGANAASGPGDFLNSMAFSPDGASVAGGGSRGAAYLWNLASDRKPVMLMIDKPYNNTMDQIDSVTFSPDSRVVACGSASGIVRTWNVPTRLNVSTFSVNSAAPAGAAARPVRTLSFTPDGKELVTADGADNTAEVWNAASGRKIATLSTHSGKISAVGFAPSGALLAATISGSGAGQAIEMWETDGSLPALARP